MFTVGILARALGPSGFGELAAGLTAAAGMSALVDSGLYSLAIAHMARNGATLRNADELVRARMTIALLLFPVAVAVLILLLGDRALVPSICALACFPYALTGYRSVVEAQQRATAVGLVLLTQSLAWLAIVALLQRAHAPLVLYAVGTVLATAVQGMVAFGVARRSGQAASGPTVSSKALLRRARSLTVSSGLTTLYYRGHRCSCSRSSLPQRAVPIAQR